ncbi:hypothetical protein [Owenweeksia hongkongensis]|uniref:hypothetical protein n=1 Tax=Owenweeksia hongkongensis TaxID=253245 RepID=UPI003A958900
MRKIIVLGCLIGASFFVAFQQNTEAEESSVQKEQSKELEMYEESELALLMREMYEDNLVLKTQIENGEIPESFPEDFYNIHTAIASKGMISDTAAFNVYAEQYLVNMKKITEATDKKQAKIAYNEMVMTCASCHQIYCQGPLPKIRKMKIKIDE